MCEKDFLGAKILVVDDRQENRDILIQLLEGRGYTVLIAPSGEIALNVVARAVPEMDGYEVCQKLKENPATQQIPVVFLTVKEEKESVLKGFAVGGVDYVTKPFDERELFVRIGTHLQISRLTKQLAEQNAELTQVNAQLVQEIKRRQQAETERQLAKDALNHFNEQENNRWGIAGFVGKSRTIEKILSEVRQVQNVGTTSVLILGEIGTGKELIARAIHLGSSRAIHPFLPVNCAGIPKDLVASTLFGHLRGAFTGAHASRKGVFELAADGTLFLDGIGEMPHDVQTMLLRVLEEHVITPLGGTRQVPVNARVIAATNADLQAKMAGGAFREDFYFRLARFVVEVPPLRERREDIPLLIEHFLAMFSREMGCAKPQLNPAAWELLENYAFPGNVRELKNIIENALIRSDGKWIEPEQLQLIGLSQRRGQPTLAEADSIPQRGLNLKPSQGVPEHPLRPETDEERIVAYVMRHGSINNSECQRLLGVDKHRANYLLNKLYHVCLLKQVGRSRSTQYVQP